LLGALMPSLETPHLMLPCDPLPSIAPDQNTLLKFCLQGNGLLFLGYGWSEPEPWGVWSLGTSSELVLSFAGNPVERIELRIAGRMLVHARRPRARGRILLNGSGVIDFEATIENPTISLQVSVAPGDLNSELIIGIQIEAPRSPAQDGISSDTRRLGFGLEEITVTCEPS
jgi:hypothetical protein